MVSIAEGGKKRNPDKKKGVTLPRRKKKKN